MAAEPATKPAACTVAAGRDVLSCNVACCSDMTRHLLAHTDAKHHRQLQNTQQAAAQPAVKPPIRSICRLASPTSAATTGTHTHTHTHTWGFGETGRRTQCVCHMLRESTSTRPSCNPARRHLKHQLPLSDTLLLSSPDCGCCQSPHLPHTCCCCQSPHLPHTCCCCGQRVPDLLPMLRLPAAVGLSLLLSVVALAEHVPDVHNLTH